VKNSRPTPLIVSIFISGLQLFSLAGLLASLGTALSVAAPSGGPYGPQPQTYTLPPNAAHVYYVAPDGNPSSPGATLDAPTTLDTAIARAVTDDAIILRGGTYRTGSLTLNQGVTLQPYAGEQPVLKGTLVASADKWTAQPNGLWRIKWKHLFPAKPANWWRRDTEGRITPRWLFNNDMVFIDGRLLKPVGWEGAIDAGSYYIDYDTGDIYIATDPAKHLVEITARDSALIRTTAGVHGKTNDHRGPTIRGITFTQYAYRALDIEGREPEGPADEATFGKDVTGATLENVTITYCSRVAGYFRGDHFTMRHCLVSDTVTEGVYLIASSDCLLEKNIFARNNIRQITGYYPAAVKIFNQTHRVTCRDNLVTDNPNSNGIWYDVGNVDAVFVDNRVQDCPNGNGFFFEISKNAICAGNVFVNCGKGTVVLNSSNARVYHNTYVNTTASFERNERSAVADYFGWHPAAGPDVDKREGHEFVGNLLVADAAYPRELLRFEQARGLCGKLTRPQAARIDDNVYARPAPAAAASRPLIVWSPASTVGGNTADSKDCTIDLPTPEALTKLHPQFEIRSRLLPLAPADVFENPAQQNYRLNRALTIPGAAPLPDDIQNLLNAPASQNPAPGACQPQQ